MTYPVRSHRYRRSIGNSIRLMLGTGMRTQEIMGLLPTHIDEDGSCIHIRQAVTMVKGTPKIGPPKTKTSYRDIPVPLSLRETAKSCAVSLRHIFRRTYR